MVYTLKQGIKRDESSDEMGDKSIPRTGFAINKLVSH